MKNLFSIVKHNLLEHEELCEMSNLRKEKTNLKADLWIEEKGESRGKKDKQPRVKIKTINHDRFPISISEDPQPLKSIRGFKKEDLDIINNAIPYIARNYDILLEHYNGELSIDELLMELARRGDYKIPGVIAEPAIMNISQVAEYLNVSVSFIRKLIKVREIPFFRIGYKLMFKKDVIDKWIKKKEDGNNKNK